LAECIGILTNVVYVGTVTAISFTILDKLVGNRVSADDELAGLDVPEMGVAGYTAEPDHPIPEARGMGRPAPASFRRPLPGAFR
jgi:Amt family ammonium transporter